MTWTNSSKIAGTSHELLPHDTPAVLSQAAAGEAAVHDLSWSSDPKQLTSPKNAGTPIAFGNPSIAIASRKRKRLLE